MTTRNVASALPVLLIAADGTVVDPSTLGGGGGGGGGGLTDTQLRATPVPVSGTVTITDGSGPVTVDGTVTANAGTGTMAVSAAALPLPSGAATAAKQPALGTAGSAATDVITVQGIASGTPQPVSGTVTTTPPSNASTNVAQVAGTTTDTNSGNKSAGTLRVVLATDQPQLTVALKVDGSATTQPVSAASLPLPSGAATDAKLDTIIAALGEIPNLKYANGTSSSSGANTMISAVSSKKFKIYGYDLMASATAVTAKLNCDTGADVTPAWPLGANGGIAKMGSLQVPLGLTSVANKALQLTLGAAQPVAWWVAYTEV